MNEEGEGGGVWKWGCGRGQPAAFFLSQPAAFFFFVQPEAELLLCVCGRVWAVLTEGPAREAARPRHVAHRAARRKRRPHSRSQGPLLPFVLLSSRLAALTLAGNRVPPSNRYDDLSVFCSFGSSPKFSSYLKNKLIWSEFADG